MKCSIFSVLILSSCIVYSMQNSESKNYIAKLEFTIKAGDKSAKANWIFGIQGGLLLGILARIEKTKMLLGDEGSGIDTADRVMFSARHDLNTKQVKTRIWNETPDDQLGENNKQEAIVCDWDTPKTIKLENVGIWTQKEKDSNFVPQQVEITIIARKGSEIPKDSGRINSSLDR